MIQTVLIPIVVILVLVVINGVFVAAEFALVGSRRSRLTLASIGLGMYGEPAVARWLYGPFED